MSQINKKQIEELKEKINTRIDVLSNAIELSDKNGYKNDDYYFTGKMLALISVNKELKELLK